MDGVRKENRRQGSDWDALVPVAIEVWRREAVPCGNAVATLLLVLLVAAAGLSGCSNGKDSNPGDDDTTPGDRRTIPAELTLKEGPPLEPPTELLGSGQGLPNEVLDAGFDKAGNLWAASSSRIFVRRHGLGAFEPFGSADGLKGEDILSIGGGLENTAWVGYRGEGDSDDDPEWMRMSGGVSRVTLDGADIQVRHYNLIAPPGLYPAYPDGRHKLRTCIRVYPTKNGPHAGDAWFGCNHGVGLVNASDFVWEHHHPIFCEWDPVRNDCTIRAGDVAAVARTANGDMWFGGTYGVMKLSYDNGARGDFWGPEPVRNTSLWEAPLSPNRFGSEDVVGVGVASDGTVWAASSHSGLARRHDNGDVETYLEANGLPANRLEDLAMDRDDGLWLATRDGGVVRIDLRTGEWRRAPGLPSSLGRRVVFERTDVGDFVVVVVRGGIAVWKR